MNLSAITTASSPTVITQKFLALIRYFNEMGLNGTITIPAGTWLLNQTLYLTQNSQTQYYPNDHGVNLAGSGESTTILQAAPGYENMLPVQIGLYQQPVNEDENALHRPQVTGVGILDSSVTSTKYGYRTLSVAPASASVNDRGPWVSGIAYNVNDLVTQNNGPNNATQSYLCTTANTASSGNQPGTSGGASYWTTPPAWTLGASYAVGNVASVTDSQGSLRTFICTTAHTTAPENNVNFQIASASRTGNTVTITTTAAHGLSAGALAAVNVSGIASTNYDMNTQGKYIQIASVPNTTTLTYNWAGQDTTTNGNFNSGNTNLTIYAATQPITGVSWRAYWREINVYADGLFDNTPLTVGPLDPTTNYTQATYWQNTNQFTLDVCVTNNSPAPMTGTICGVLGLCVASTYLNSVWSLYSNGSQLYFILPQPAGVANEKNMCIQNYIQIGSAPPGQGTHRISIQLDFRSGEQYLAAWVDGVQQGINGTNATYALPAGAAFMPYVYGGFYLGRDNYWTSAMNNSDWTFAGLSMSNVTRYTVSTVGSQQKRADSQTLNDNLRYFTQDAYTIGYLALDDAPPADTDYNNPAWQTIRVQSGDAATPSGQTPSIANGIWSVEPWNASWGYCGGANITNLTIQKVMGNGAISAYGSDISMFDAYGTELLNVTLNGGLTAFNVQPHGNNQYVNRLYNVSLNASFAGFYAYGSTMTMGNNITFPSPGKHAIYSLGTSNDFRNITIGPATYSDYLVEDLNCDWLSPIYSGVTIQPDPNHTYPTKGVFYHEWSHCGDQQLRIDNCTALNLPPNIVFIELPDFSVSLHIPPGIWW